MKKYVVTIKAVSSAGHALKGAAFRVADQNGRVQSTSASLRLASGTYRVTENKAPAGYRAAFPQKFRVTASGSVLVKGRTQQGRTVTLVNRRASGKRALRHNAAAKAASSGKAKTGKKTVVKRAAAEGEISAESSDVNDSDSGDGTGSVEGEKEQTLAVSDAVVQPLAENMIENANTRRDMSSYITSISVDKSEVTTPEYIKITASFSDGGVNEHVFRGGDTITIKWPKSQDAYIQGFSKNVFLVSDDGVTYASAAISSDQAVITFNSNVDRMYDVSGDIWFEALAVNNASGNEENKSSVTIQGGSSEQSVTIIKPKMDSGSGGTSKTPFFRKQADAIGGVWKNIDGKYAMSLDPTNPTYTKWILTANETHETGIRSPIIIRDTLGAGQEIDHNGDAVIYGDGRLIPQYSGTLDKVVNEWNDQYGVNGSSLQIKNGNIVWTIQPDIANGVGWHLQYSCMITDYSLPLLQNEADLTYTDQNGESKTMHDASYFVGVNAGGDITALPRGVLQITKKIQGTDQTAAGVTFTVEKKDGQLWTPVGTMTTNTDGIATMYNLKAGKYGVYESSHPDYLNDDFTVDTETYSQDNPYTFTVDENDKNGIAVTAEDSIKTTQIRATKNWQKADGTEDKSEHPSIWFQLYRKNKNNPAGKTTAVENSIRELRNGTTSSHLGKHASVRRTG
ncbi:MAG: SpaA isopeptide-forming pilin-related protein [Eubacterium sp.]